MVSTIKFTLQNTVFLIVIQSGTHSHYVYLNLQVLILILPSKLNVSIGACKYLMRQYGMTSLVIRINIHLLDFLKQHIMNCM